jgi:hypothetical protein
MKTPGQDSLSVGRDLSPRPPEYDAGVDSTRPRISVASLYTNSISINLLTCLTAAEKPITGKH